MVASKHDLENREILKPKRFKVGKACYTCRLKKIKVNCFFNFILHQKCLMVLLIVRWLTTLYAGKNIYKYRMITEKLISKKKKN